jgi:hypothetical protein
VAWGWTLLNLYKNVTNADKILPKKNIFKLHGSLISLFLVFFLLWYIADVRAVNTTGNTSLVWFGFQNLFLILQLIFECMTFLLVIFLMNPS